MKKAFTRAAYLRARMLARRYDRLGRSPACPRDAYPPHCVWEYWRLMRSRVDPLTVPLAERLNDWLNSNEIPF
jgi:hypothetical protein